MTINELINNVVEAREVSSRATEKRREVEEECRLANKNWYDAEEEAKERLNFVEQALREEALRLYSETGEKKVAPGIGIRINKRVEYDPSGALDWGKKHGMCLTLDVKSFNKLAVDGLITDFEVVITEEPQATIAKELEKVNNA